VNSGKGSGIPFYNFLREAVGNSDAGGKGKNAGLAVEKCGVGCDLVFRGKEGARREARRGKKPLAEQGGVMAESQRIFSRLCRFGKKKCAGVALRSDYRALGRRIKIIIDKFTCQVTHLLLFY
jgi:hypothetical protein